MPRLPLVVALPVKDGAPYLAAAIESVLAQEGVAFELRIYDNGSTDGSLEIAERYLGDPRVRLVRNERDLHCYGSLNRAIAEAHDAEYVAMFASDDLMLPGNLAAKVALLDETGAGFAHSLVRVITGSGRFICTAPDMANLAALTPAPDFFRRVVPTNNVCLPSVVARRCALLDVGGFDGRVTYCADWHLWMRLSLRFAVASIPDALVEIREHEASGTSAGARSAVHATQTPAALEHILDDASLAPAWREQRASLVAAHALYVAHELRRGGHRRARSGHSAYAFVLRALLEQPRHAGIAAMLAEDLRAACLLPLAPSFPVVAAAATEASGAVELVATLRALAGSGLASHILLGAAEHELERAADVMGSALESASALDVELFPVGALEELVTPGTLVLAPFGDDAVARLEALNVPVLPYDLPTPFATPAVVGLWQRIDPDAERAAA
jgi:glycosyltransferase involved in cell wall biosynthesis